MTKYVAFLRGIAPMNPNMKNEKLHGVFETLGFNNVISVISSGNIIFETTEKDVAALEQRIEKALHSELGITSTTIIRSAKQLQHLLKSKPFGNSTHTNSTYLLVTFLKHQPTKPLKFPEGYLVAAIYNREVCTIVNNSGAKRRDPTLWLEKNHGKEITSRTWLTVEKILKKMRSS